MIKIDFRKVTVEYRIDERREMDIRHGVGNAIHQNTADIGLMDFARTIYHSTGPVEIPGEYHRYMQAIIGGCETLIAPVKVAVLSLLNEPGATTEKQEQKTTKKTRK